jgi:hypothetical protein
MGWNGPVQDRPGCQKQKGDPQYEEDGALVNCNVRIADVERMEHVVGQAIRRWYAEFGDGGSRYGQQWWLAIITLTMTAI